MDSQITPSTNPPSQRWGFVDRTDRRINLLDAFSRATDVHATYYHDRAIPATGDLDTLATDISGGDGDSPSNGSLGAYSLTSQILRHLEYIDGGADEETEAVAEAEADEVGVQMSLESHMGYSRSAESPTSSTERLAGFSQPESASMQPQWPRRDHGAKGFSRVYEYQADLRLMTPAGPRTGSGRLKHLVFARPEWMELEELEPLDESSTADIQIRNLVIGLEETNQVNGHHTVHGADHDVDVEANVTGRPLLRVAPTTLDTAHASIDGDTISWELIGTRDFVCGARISCNGETVEGDVFHEMTLDITLDAD